MPFKFQFKIEREKDIFAHFADESGSLDVSGRVLTNCNNKNIITDYFSWISPPPYYFSSPIVRTHKQEANNIL